ncbi:predicted protein [Naegleria gruberi]|nr:uncharacterized protein NAEGRDRAFT_76264 [Naegleria gruberi]EFC36071.1 predicted protein [Naegleria gruberi]|eukprot:XP_002668815.1 predicted protein [Naegleria gruberi strain NEG-M]
MRRHFLPICDIFQIVYKSSNPLFYLIQRVGEACRQAKWIYKPSDCMLVFEALYPLFVEMKEEEYENLATSPSIVKEAAHTPLCFSSLFSPKIALPVHVRAIHKKLLAITEDNIFRILLDIIHTDSTQKNFSLFKMAIECALENPSEFAPTLMKNRIAAAMGSMRSGSFNEQLSEFLIQIHPIVDSICESKKW